MWTMNDDKRVYEAGPSFSGHLYRVASREGEVYSSWTEARDYADTTVGYFDANDGWEVVSRAIKSAKAEARNNQPASELDA